MTKSEVSALISLLDDPDEGVFNHIKDKLMAMGNEVIPMLENAWETSFDSLLQNRVENLIHTIQFDAIKTNLKSWRKSGKENRFIAIRSMPNPKANPEYTELS